MNGDVETGIGSVTAARPGRVRRVLRTLWIIADRLAMPAWVPVVLLIVLLVPIKSVSELGYDEGFNLAKAKLVTDGYLLYDDIWSDQPPLHTLVLAQVYELSEAVRPGEAWLPIFAGRVLTLSATALMVSGLYRLMRREIGAFSATTAILLLAFSWWFLPIGTAILIGLPAVALAVIGTLAAVISVEKAALPTRSPLAATAAGVAGGLFALSLLVKAIAWFAPLVAIVYVLVAARENRWRLSAVVAVGFVITLLVVGWLTNAHQSIIQIARTGLGEQTRTAFADGKGIGDRFVPFILRNPPLVLAGLGGLVWLGRPRWDGEVVPSRAWIATGWLLVGAIFIAFHRPIWWHHYLLLSLPMAWLSGYGLQLLVSRLTQAEWSRRPNDPVPTHPAGMAVVVISGILVLGTALDPMGRPHFKNEIRDYPVDFEAVHVVRAAPPGPIFTDRLIFATLTHRNVPPNWAVLSAKRLASQPQLKEQMAVDLEEAGVVAVVVERWSIGTFGPKFTDWLEEHFYRADEPGGAAVYLRKGDNAPISRSAENRQ